jgi:hypothetical protein
MWSYPTARSLISLLPDYVENKVMHHRGQAQVASAWIENYGPRDNGCFSVGNASAKICMRAQRRVKKDNFVEA